MPLSQLGMLFHITLSILQGRAQRPPPPRLGGGWGRTDCLLPHPPLLCVASLPSSFSMPIWDSGRRVTKQHPTSEKSNRINKLQHEGSRTAYPS